VEQKAAMVLEYSDYGYVLEMGNNLPHYLSLCKIGLHEIHFET
jgi:hypothetical protein